MEELAMMLPQWQNGRIRCVGSILYSDIGKEYYPKVGWQTWPENSHMESQLLHKARISPEAHRVSIDDLAGLCYSDEAMMKKSISKTPSDKLRMAVVPDLDHMLWHMSKEHLACGTLFGVIPQAKGAIAGDRGNRVWCLWAHRYYGHPRQAPDDKTLYILRLVVENGRPSARDT